MDPGAAGGCDKVRQYLGRVSVPGGNRSGPDVPPDFAKAVDLGELNARVRIGREADGDAWRSVLVIEICGTIGAPDEDHEVALEISVSDVTDSAAGSLPVLTRPKYGPLQGSAHFIYQADMGKLCRQTTVLEDWTTLAQLSPEWFVLPRQGSRRLQYNLTIVSRQTREPLAAASCIGVFENIETGYLDIEDNIQRAKTLAVGLAFSVGAANNALRDAELDVIHGWVRTNFGSTNVSTQAKLELQRALEKTAAFFRKGGRLDVQNICGEIVDIAPMVGRLEMMDLCLRVAGAKGQVTQAELTLLKNVAEWLEVDRTRLRAMVEKVLPVSMHESRDAEMILGVTEEMSEDEARHQLNREYAKWSSRVISSDPAIRKQADQMLNLIADARTQYVGVRPSR